MSQTFVFLGPTLSHRAAREILGDATYLPPASMGDVYDVLKLNPSTIAIIDGYFDQTPSVWHKEILLALSRGVRVLGSSSMGALRAAELHVFGMEGVGAIFEAFRDGVLNDDDEVAVVHGDASSGHRVMSDAMVNLRAGLRTARDRGLIGEATRARLEELAKGRFYAERSWSLLLSDGQKAGLAAAELEALRQYVRSESPDAKRDDALELLRRLAQGPATREPSPPSFTLERSPFLDMMGNSEASILGLHPDPGLPGQRVTRPILGQYVRTMTPQPQPLLREALYLHLLVNELERTGRLEPPSALEYFESLVERFRDEQQGEALAAEIDALESKMLRIVRLGVDRALPVVLQRRGELRQTVARLEERQNALATIGAKAPQLQSEDIEPEQLMEWYAARMGSPRATSGELAARVGLDQDTFESEVLAAYMAEALARGPG